MKSNLSWIVVSRASGLPVLETYSQNLVAKINTNKYEVLTALEWLQRFNKQVAAEDAAFVREELK
jgi:hypothetical protein